MLIAKKERGEHYPILNERQYVKNAYKRTLYIEQGNDKRYNVINNIIQISYFVI